jgi:hypothetical protein
MMLKRGVLWSIVILSLAVAISGCSRDVPPVCCECLDFQCYMTQATKGVGVVREEIEFWSLVHLVARGLTVVFGLVATIMLAIQGDKNKWWTRPTGLVATALVTGLTSALISFHVPENVDKLVDIVGDMAKIANEFDSQAQKLKEGRSKEEIENAYRNDPEFRNKVIDLTNRFANDYNKIKLDMLRLKGSAAKLNLENSPLNRSTLQPATKE